MKCSSFALVFCLLSVVESCSYFGTYQYERLSNDEPYEFKYWKTPNVTLESAKEEAIMIIGGRHCLARSCTRNFTRVENGKREFLEQSFLPFDNTIKFFTKYGFCRLPNFTLPNLPLAVTSVGAVATPEGRVIICGGHQVQLGEGGRLESRNVTSCWYWIQGTTIVKDLEFFSKIPFDWLGPFTPKQFQLVHFKHVESTSRKAEPRQAESNKKLEQKIGWGHLIDRWKKDDETDKKEGKNSPEELKQMKAFNEQMNAKTTTDSTTTTSSKRTGPFTDRFTYNTDRENPMEFYRIIALPWPAYTDAFKFNPRDGGGNLIEGQIRITKMGPRIFWKKHQLQDMPIGYGGCFVTEPRDDGTIRIHTFGGRELGVDGRGFDTGWTQDSDLLTKYPRYFDIGLEIYLAKQQNGSKETNSTGNIYFVDSNRAVERPKCRRTMTYKEILLLMSAGGRLIEEALQIAKRERIEDDLKTEEMFVKLEQDRIFQTCHVLPVIHGQSEYDIRRRNRNDIILIGGGTGPFEDRHFIIPSDYTYTGLSRAVARYKIEPVLPCREPGQSGKGHWVAEDLTFGYGLNIPRTRHASEIIKTLDDETNQTVHTIWVFGGYSKSVGDGEVLDSVESFKLGTIPQNFKLWDGVPGLNEWKYRLPWPLMDITTVKIPVDWLPRRCRLSYYNSKQAAMKNKTP